MKTNKKGFMKLGYFNILFLINFIICGIFVKPNIISLLSNIIVSKNILIFLSLSLSIALAMGISFILLGFLNILLFNDKFFDWYLGE